MSTIVQDAAEQTRPNQLVEPDPQYPSEDRAVSVSSLAGASPAVPRDPRLLLAEQADYEAQLQKVPYMLVVGDKEKAASAVAVRARGNQDLGVMPLDAFVGRVTQELAARV